MAEPIIGKVFVVFGVTTDGQNSTVDFRVQGFDSPVEDFRLQKTRRVGVIGVVGKDGKCMK